MKKYNQNTTGQKPIFNEVDNTAGIEKLIYSSSLRVLNNKEMIAEAESTPERVKLFGSFVRTGYNTLFFSQTNYGKSALAFQIAYHITKGSSISSDDTFINQAEPKKVLYYDAELDAKTFYDRYGAALKKLNPKMFLYVLEQKTGKILMGAELIDELTRLALMLGAEFIILDNLSKILPDTVDAKQSTEIIEKLKQSRIKTGADWLVVGHTTKTSKAQCIKDTDYHGSAMIQNFFLEIFYLDETNDGRFFLRHAKCKNDDGFIDKVPVLDRKIIDAYGLGFEFVSVEPYSSVKKADILTNENHSDRKIKDFEKEFKILYENGIGISRMAILANCHRKTISTLVNNKLP
jgi:RecA-family ATPase